MRRIPTIAVLLLAAPACAFAQSTSAASSASPVVAATATAASAPAKAKSRNPFGEAMAELTRQARERAGQRAASSEDATAAPATKPEALSHTAPVLADSNGR